MKINLNALIFIRELFFVQMTAFRQHFEEQEYYYGRQFLISLVRKFEFKDV